MPGSMISEEAITRRAHEIWEEEGRPEGRSQAHWEQARTELAEAAAMASQGSADTAQAILADETAAATERPPVPFGDEKPPAPSAVKITRRRTKPKASDMHEAVDGTPDSPLDNISPTPRGRGRGRAEGPAE